MKQGYWGLRFLQGGAAAAMLLSIHHSASAQWYDNRFYITPMASFVLADDDRTNDNGYGGTLALGKRLSPRLEFELRGTYLEYEADDQRHRLLGIPIGPAPQDVEVTAGGAGLNFFLDPGGGGLYGHVDAMGGDSTLYNAGIGFSFGTAWAVRTEILYHNDDGDYEETQFNIGVHIPFGSAPPLPRPEPVRVIPAAPPPPPACTDGVDNDADGLIDYPQDPGCTDVADPDESNPPPCELPAAGQAISLDGCEVGDTLILRGVNFEFDEATLTPRAMQILDEVGQALSMRTDIVVEIAGHTDSLGTQTYNQDLSQRRAASVKTYLVDRGIQDGRMSTVGFGETMPIADNQTEEGRAMNRRVELKVMASDNPEEVSGDAIVTPAEDAAQDNQATASEPLVDAVEQAPENQAASVASVAISDFSFQPASLTVSPGTTVTWTNQDGSTHTVKFGDAVSQRLGQGGVSAKTFETSGIYTYTCSLHPSMAGTIIVE